MLTKFKELLSRQPSWVPKAIVAGLAVLLIIVVVAIVTSMMPKENEEVVPPDVEDTQTVLPLEPETKPEPEIEPEEESEPEPEPEPELPYVNPMTGEGSEVDYEHTRPYAIMLNNLKKAVPQLGVSQADIIFECPVEGNITRMMAIYQSVDDVGTIGSIRSARDYFVSIAAGMDALYLHAGGSPGAYTAIKELGVAGFDCVNGPYEGSLYWRDPDRRANIGLEHSVVTSGETITEKFASYSVRKEYRDSFVPSFNFDAEAEMVNGVDVKGMTVRYSDYKTGVFTYDQELEKYLVREYGEPYSDGNNGAQVAVTNVLVLRTDVSAIAGDTAGRLSVRLTGSGSGLYMAGGQAVEISWKRSGNTAPFCFYTKDGEPLTLAVGNSYVNVVSERCDVSLEKG